MKSIILSTGARMLLPLMLVFAFFLLLRGHNEPGGGFVGGLVAGSTFVLYAIAYGPERLRTTLKINPHSLIATGLLFASVSATISLFRGQPFMTSQWGHREFPGIGYLSTPLVFDTGVMLVVTGIVLTIMVSLSEE